MLLKIVYLLACQILGLTVVLARGDQAAADRERIHRKPVLGGLINEYARAA